MDPSSRDFFHGTREESLSITFLSDFGYLESFRRYSRSKSKVVKNRAEFWKFFRFPNFRGPAFQKLYPRYDLCLAARCIEMFCGDTCTGPEVIGVHTLNFKPHFKFSRLEFFGGTPVLLRVCDIKVWSISSACKIFGAQHPLWTEI